MWPACAKAPSISPATDESRPENTSFGARPGVAASTCQPRDIVRQRGGETPGARVAIRLALRSLAGAEPGDLEPRMVREQRDELLADHAGRAENADFDLLTWATDASSSYGDTLPCRSKKKADAV